MPKKTVVPKKTKSTNMKSTPGPFRVELIPYEMHPKDFTWRMQEVMNLAEANNLRFEMSYIPTGILFILRPAPTEQPPSLHGLLQRLLTHGKPAEEAGPLSQRTEQVIDEFAQGVNWERPETFPEEVQKRGDKILKHFDNAALHTMAQELEKEIEAHKGHSDCITAKFLGAIAEHMKQCVALNLS